jgi:hypothetical protein
MTAEPPKSYSLDDLLALLRAHGPVEFFTYEGRDAHVRLVIGAAGDGTACGTTITYIGPGTGNVSEVPYADFMAHYEVELRGHSVRAVHY